MTAEAKTGVDTRRVKYILKFYNSIACEKVERLDEIPIDAANAIMSIRYDVLITPFVLNDMDRGWGRNALATKYGVGEKLIRTIGIKNRGKK